MLNNYTGYYYSVILVVAVDLDVLDDDNHLRTSGVHLKRGKPGRFRQMTSRKGTHDCDVVDSIRQPVHATY